MNLTRLGASTDSEQENKKENEIKALVLLFQHASMLTELLCVSSLYLQELVSIFGASVNVKC